MSIDWSIKFLDVRLFYWAYFSLSLIALLVVILYWQREFVKKIYYKMRFPEKLIKVNLIYPGGYIRYFWRLIPDDKTFEIDGGTYNYDNQSILKTNDWFTSKDLKNKDSLILKIDGKEYNLNDKLKIKNRWETWPQVFFIEGHPFAVDWHTMIAATQEIEKDGELQEIPIRFNARDLTHLKKATILQQIMSSMEGDTLIKVVLVLVIILMILVGAILANDAGLIQLAAQNSTKVV